MRFHSASSNATDSKEAVGYVMGEAQAALKGKVDVALAFFTGHDPSEVEQMVERLWLGLDPQALLGCLAEGVVTGAGRIESQPGLALLVAALPQVRVHSFRIANEEWPSLLRDGRTLRQRLRWSEDTRAIVALGDPVTTPLPKLLAALASPMPQAAIVVGLPSGGPTPGGNVLLRNDQVHRQGLVGLSLAGALSVETVQLPLSDAARAQKDLHALLAAWQSAGVPAGALLFNGDGLASASSGSPREDILTLGQFPSDTPLAGFLATGGQSGPQGRTASLALFRPIG